MNIKKYRIIYITLSIALLTIMGSCATVPVADEPVVGDEVVVVEPVVEEPVLVDETLVLEALAAVKVAKEEAKSAKAPKAASKEYNEGEEAYSEGLEAYANGNFDATLEFYGLATKAYKKAIITANEQKEIALAALANAEAAIAQAELNANNAITNGLEEDK